MARERRLTAYTILAVFVALIPLLALVFLFTIAVLPQRVAEECFRCHTELKAKLKQTYLHPIFKERDCLSCHNRHAGPPKKAGLKKETQKNLCSTCHLKQAKEGDNPKPHPPFEAVFKKDGRCTTCHDPHASETAGILENPQKRQCLMCHPSIAKFLAFESKHLHPPFRWVFETGGKCTQCHNAHGSSNDFILKFPQNILCRMCHPTIAGLFDAPFQHRPFTEGKCTRCHNPHGSANVKFLKEPQPFICFTCHNPQRVDEAPNIQGLFLKEASHHPVLEPGKTTGRQIVCTDCHKDIHGSLYVRLLGASGSNFCYRCHSDKGQFFDQIGHGKDPRMPLPASGTGIRCLNCHQSIHGSDFERLFLKIPVARCLDCHEQPINSSDTLPKVGPKGHRHPIAFDRPGMKDPKAGVPMTCYSTCHNPHGTGNQELLRVPGSPPASFSVERQLDRFCLQCHPKVGLEF